MLVIMYAWSYSSKKFNSCVEWQPKHCQYLHKSCYITCVYSAYYTHVHVQCVSLGTGTS